MAAQAYESKLKQLTEQVEALQKRLVLLDSALEKAEVNESVKKLASDLCIDLELKPRDAFVVFQFETRDYETGNVCFYGVFPTLKATEDFIRLYSRPVAGPGSRSQYLPVREAFSVAHYIENEFKGEYFWAKEGLEKVASPAYYPSNAEYLDLKRVYEEQMKVALKKRPPRARDMDGRFAPNLTVRCSTAGCNSPVTHSLSTPAWDGARHFCSVHSPDALVDVFVTSANVIHDSAGNILLRLILGPVPHAYTGPVPYAFTVPPNTPFSHRLATADMNENARNGLLRELRTLAINFGVAWPPNPTAMSPLAFAAMFEGKRGTLRRRQVT